MKYIRTKTTIKEFDSPYHSWENDKQADTIEELCDKFVFFEETQRAPTAGSPCSGLLYKAIKNRVLKGIKKGMNCWFKLAIWTDKGLIYVAKMNKEGDLELL